MKRRGPGISPGPRRIRPSTRRRQRRGALRTVLGHDPRHEALPFRDSLDLDGDRLDRAFDPLEPLVVGRWRKLLNRPGSDEPAYEGTPEWEPDADGEDGDDPGLDEVEQIGVGHGGFG